MDEPAVKPVRWIASSRDDLREFPEEVRLRIGGALWEAQKGGKALWAKPLKGYGGSAVVEIVEDHEGDTYRASTRCGSRAWSMCFTPSRKSPGAGSRRRARISRLSRRG